MGTVVGVHEVILHTGTQQLTLKHEAVTRAMLADGAVVDTVYLSELSPAAMRRRVEKMVE